MGAPEDLERKKREILRKIYTSPQNLYQPFAADDDATPQIDEQESVSCGAPLRSIPGKRTIPPVEEEDDYGEVIENPRYRLGATINPLSMFATSTSDARNTEVEIISTTEIRVDLIPPFWQILMRSLRHIRRSLSSSRSSVRAAAALRTRTKMVTVTAARVSSRQTREGIRLSNCPKRRKLRNGRRVPAHPPRRRAVRCRV